MSDLLILCPTFMHAQGIDGTTEQKTPSWVSFDNTTGFTYGELSSQLIYSSLAQVGVKSAAGTSTVIDIDLDSDGQGHEDVFDTLILARAKLLTTVDATTTIKVQNADTYFTPIGDTGTFTIASNLAGKNSNHFVRTSGVSSAFTTPRRYYRVTITSTSSFKHQVGKLALAKCFDMGRDPIYPVVFRPAEINGSHYQQKLLIDLTWDGITAEKAAQFRRDIVEYASTLPMYLSTNDSSNHQATMNYKIIPVYLRDCTITHQRYNNFRINAIFEENI